MESWATLEDYANLEAFSVKVVPNIAGAGIGTSSYRGSTVGYFASVGTSTLLFWTMTAIGIGRWPETGISLQVTTFFVGVIIFAAATTLGMLPRFLSRFGLHGKRRLTTRGSTLLVAWSAPLSSVRLRLL
jgi:hypothetical protein